MRINVEGSTRLCKEGLYLVVENIKLRGRSAVESDFGVLWGIVETFSVLKILLLSHEFLKIFSKYFNIHFFIFKNLNIKILKY
jgi:hypothetical protein